MMDSLTTSLGQFLVIFTTVCWPCESQLEGKASLIVFHSNDFIIDTLDSVHITGSPDTPMLGHGYNLTCTVSEASVTNYQWRKDDTMTMLDETTATLSFQSLALSDAASYTCIVTVDSSSFNSSTGIMLQCK